MGYEINVCSICCKKMEVEVTGVELSGTMAFKNCFSCIILPHLVEPTIRCYRNLHYFFTISSKLNLGSYKNRMEYFVLYCISVASQLLCCL